MSRRKAAPFSPSIHHVRIVLGMGAASISLALAVLAAGLMIAGLIGPSISETPATAQDHWLAALGVAGLVWAICLFISSVRLAEGRRNARRLALAAAPVVLSWVVAGALSDFGWFADSLSLIAFAGLGFAVWVGVAWLGFTDPKRWTTAGPATSLLLNPTTPRP